MSEHEHALPLRKALTSTCAVERHAIGERLLARVRRSAGFAVPAAGAHRFDVAVPAPAQLARGPSGRTVVYRFDAAVRAPAELGHGLSGMPGCCARVWRSALRPRSGCGAGRSARHSSRVRRSVLCPPKREQERAECQCAASHSAHSRAQSLRKRLSSFRAPAPAKAGNQPESKPQVSPEPLLLRAALQ